jgi:pantoate--beta-alanine ligase
MHVITKIDEMTNYSTSEQDNGEVIGFVPTMGYLHDGHLSLVQKAKQNCDKVILSIYINPTQFSPSEDLDKYPRDLERDKELCKEAGVDALFFPSDSEMYPENYRTYIQVEGLSELLCGVTRPHHFKGVTTIVAKLFNIVLPHRAYFGLKDYQQYTIIRRMAKDLNMGVDVVGCPTVREGDGLAMSSRNVYLNQKQREESRVLYESLRQAQGMFDKGITDVKMIKDHIRARIEETEGVIDYIEMVNPDSLQSVEEVEERDVILLAVYFGGTRLIDNKILT